jgi:hypothetical protein
MKRAWSEVAKEYIKGEDVDEGILNRMEHVIPLLRSMSFLFHPCCGQDASALEVVSHDGECLRWDGTAKSSRT